MTATRSLRSILRATFLLVLPTLIVCLAILEIGLRLQGHLPSNVTDGIFVAHGNAFRLRPNQTKLSRTPSFTCTIRTNALGLRDRAPGPRALGRPYLAWLGDSATFANGVEYEESFVGRFGTLAEPRGLEVVNLAVGGHHLAEQQEMLDDFVAAVPRRPEAVVVMFTPQLMALFEERYEGLIIKNGYIFARKGWLKSYVTVMLGNTSSAYCFLRDGIRKVQTRLFSRGPDAAGDILETYSRSGPLTSEETTRRLEDTVARLDDHIRRAGATPVHVYLPTTADLRGNELLALTRRGAEAYDLDHYRDALRRESTRAGVQLVDLTGVLKAEYAKGAPLGFVQDMHYNAGAHAVIARALFDEIVERGGRFQGDAAAAARGATLRPTSAPSSR